MDFQLGLVRMGTAESMRLAEEAQASGWRVFTLSGDRIKSRSDFFAAVRQTLPLDPPLQSDRSWDALSDSLWEGLHQLSDAKVAIIWQNSDAMAHADRREYEIATSVLEDVAQSLAKPENTVGKPKVVSMVLA